MNSNRLVAHFVFVDLTYNHISVRAPEEAAHFLVKPANVFMEQVTASNLVKYDIDGRQVLVLSRAIRVQHSWRDSARASRLKCSRAHAFARHNRSVRAKTGAADAVATGDALP